MPMLDCGRLRRRCRQRSSVHRAGANAGAIEAPTACASIAPQSKSPLRRLPYLLLLPACYAAWPREQGWAGWAIPMLGRAGGRRRPVLSTRGHWYRSAVRFGSSRVGRFAPRMASLSLHSVARLPCVAHELVRGSAYARSVSAHAWFGRRRSFQNVCTRPISREEANCCKGSANVDDF